MNIAVTSAINFDPVIKKLGGDQLGMYASNDWYRLVQPYMPHRDGELERNVTIKPWQFTHNVNYGVPVYNGKNFNFRTDFNSKATYEWDKRAIQEKQGDKLADSIQKWVNRNI